MATSRAHPWSPWSCTVVIQYLVAQYYRLVLYYYSIIWMIGGYPRMTPGSDPLDLTPPGSGSIHYQYTIDPLDLGTLYLGTLDLTPWI